MTRKQVFVGGVPMGGGAPVTIQSMCNTHTADVDATVAQILRLEEAGCEIVRVSVYDMDCANAVKEIKKRIRIPLVADVHFDHRLAIAALENGVDKLRINPGNIGGAKKVQELAAAAKDRGAPIRVGVNGGSLERELLMKYGGPTAEALAESALGHAKLLENEGFYDIVLSVKSSDVKRTVQANRILHEKTIYPLHIGVTEAGAGEQALIKSAVGVGSLLIDGIGDTVRVSITGDPAQEPVAALAILKAAGLRKTGAEIISCPTCGRCKADLLQYVEKVRAALPQTGRYIKVAVMGCVVNGPGESKEADIGIAFSPGGCVLFKKGDRIAAFHDYEEGIDALIAEAKGLSGEI
ncbi:MAG: flavodoxin-dependent (E)-4-hydroxy-3-methylbut-2-enyl-diphosphate synthase [Christensenellales bacterium]|jgi:(E)-4-hydroxy-3-methylbut-2-enyl-diphosphate synthase